MKRQVAGVSFLLGLLALVSPLTGEEAKPGKDAVSATKQKMVTNSLLSPFQPGIGKIPGTVNKWSVSFNPLNLICLALPDNINNFAQYLSLTTVAFEWSLIPSGKWTILSAVDSHLIGNYQHKFLALELGSRFYYWGNRMKGGGWLEGGLSFADVYIAARRYNFFFDIAAGYRIGIGNFFVEPYIKGVLPFDSSLFSIFNFGINIGYHELRANRELMKKSGVETEDYRAVFINLAGSVCFIRIALNDYNSSLFTSLFSVSSVTWEWKLGKLGKWSYIFAPTFRMHSLDTVSMLAVTANQGARYYYTGDFATGGIWSALGVKLGYLSEFNPMGASYYNGLDVELSFQSGYRFRVRGMILELSAGYDLVLVSPSSSYAWIGVNIGYYRSRVKK